ncbi:NADH-cytochrome b5 reductase-like isoform X1 [Bombus vancouverensis nearcticus]|uniref:NADH-cytochrome b5 reductase-like isoform X1 n=2 Tax=Bombus bifarius TaxID=103933 RepID=A0A6P8MJW1_9HYME|nr:NADH-cytochrome b5 reductase-like isoform X1 [Bombus vancouverensis nearcticus]XP_033308563.1 NADH-cytochrome b5 reductase-like isoform X1 [Bombus bifarius]
MIINILSSHSLTTDVWNTLYTYKTTNTKLKLVLLVLYSMFTDNNNEDSRPVTPSQEDCCHSACDPCIFDIHKKLLEEYERKKKQNIKINNRSNVLHLYEYRNFVVSGIQEISECYILLVLKYNENNYKDYSILIDPGQYVILHLHDAAKPYTPISFTDDSIEFLIRIYPNGKFSQYLESIKVGDTVRIRGPYGNFKYESNSFQTIIMFSMGSGITAVYPIAKSIVDNESEETKIHLIGGFKNILQIPLKKELQTLSDYWNFKCTLHISQLQNLCSLHGIDVKSGRLNEKSIFEILQDKIASTTLILICGSSHFNKSVAQWVKCMNYIHIHVFE